MELTEFIKNVANQFDETELNEFSPETIFHDLDEWSSLTALAVMNIISKKYGINIKQDEMRTANTIQELYELVQSKL